MGLVRMIECFEYTFDRYSNPGYCEIFVYLCPDGKTLVIAAEPGNDYEGPSVTNTIERIATEVTKHLGIHFDYFVEYYPPLNGHMRRGETFDLVTFQPSQAFRRDYVGLMYQQPDWKHATRSEIEALTGCPVLVFEAR